jgi:DNA-binding NtrC family response regulator
VKLLRALQESEVEPVGARKPVKVDVRIVSATNRDLIADVKTGRFREDLFYRLHVFPIGVPPLRTRRDDIPDLVRHFVTRFAAEEGKRVSRVSPDALALLMTHPWPGNVRQLENAVFRAVVMADGDEIGVGEFPQIAASQGQAMPAGSMADLHPDLGAGVTIAPPAAPELTIAGSSLALTDAQGNVRPFEALERDIIRFAISHYRGQMSEVARRLAIGRSTLYRKLESLNVDAEPVDG